MDDRVDAIEARIARLEADLWERIDQLAQYVQERTSAPLVPAFPGQPVTRVRPVEPVIDAAEGLRRVEALKAQHRTLVTMVVRCSREAPCRKTAAAIVADLRALVGDALVSEVKNEP
jgi:hypothetical protein